MLPAAISCSSGFHRCVRFFSISVTAAFPRRPSLSPSRVTSSSPPAPPPTTTIRCNPWRAASAGGRSSALGYGVKTSPGSDIGLHPLSDLALSDLALSDLAPRDFVLSELGCRRAAPRPNASPLRSLPVATLHHPQTTHRHPPPSNPTRQHQARQCKEAAWSHPQGRHQAPLVPRPAPLPSRAGLQALPVGTGKTPGGSMLPHEIPWRGKSLQRARARLKPLQRPARGGFQTPNLVALPCQPLSARTGSGACAQARPAAPARGKRCCRVWPACIFRQARPTLKRTLKRRTTSDPARAETPAPAG